MPDQDTTIADGDPGHAQIHVDVATEVNSLRARMLANEQKDTQQDTTLTQKYTKPTGGIPASDLAPGALPANVQGGATNPWTDMSQRNASLTVNHYRGSRAAFDAGTGPLTGVDILWATGT